MQKRNLEFSSFDFLPAGWCKAMLCQYCFFHFERCLALPIQGFRSDIPNSKVGGTFSAVLEQFYPDAFHGQH